MKTLIFARVVAICGCLLLLSCDRATDRETLPQAKHQRPTSSEVPSFRPVALLGQPPKTTQGGPADRLKLHVRLETPNDQSVVDIDDPFRITLENASDRPIRIWNPRTRNGYYQLEFRLSNMRTGLTHIVSRTPIDDDGFWEWYEDDVQPGEETIEIAPAGEFTFYETLGALQGDHWVWTGLPDPNSNDQFVIEAQFASSRKAEDGAPAVWRGRIETEMLTAILAASRLKTPHDYLWHSFPTKALKMMQADRSWIGRRDESQRTPLHLAARYGHAEVVSWLLENGADVNAIAYNGFTPLHVTDHPEAIAEILKHKPDLSIRCRIQGRTPLQEAVAELADAQSESEQQKWKRIVGLYRDAGADYDLLVAIHLDDLKRVKSILSESPNLANDFQEASPLRTAASLGRLEICRYLIDKHHVDVNDFRRGVGYPIIKQALVHPDVVKLLIESGADLKTRITWRGFRTGVWIIGDDATALHYAAADGVPETVRLLIDNGVDVFATAHDSLDENSKQTALEVAAYFGKAGNARAILEHPKFREAEPAVRKQLLDKCLMVGAFSSSLARTANRPELLAELLKHGADPNVTHNGMTALQIAVREIHPSNKRENKRIRNMAALLEQNGATVDLFTAVAVGNEAQVRRLLHDAPDSANERAYDGYPALHFSVAMNYQGIVKQLLDAGCDVDIRNKSDHTGSIDETALHCAAFWGRTEIARLLVNAGADIHARTERRGTPLHNAARMTNVEIVRLLLEHGADADAKDEDGETPLDWAYRPAEVEPVFREYRERGAR